MAITGTLIEASWPTEELVFDLTDKPMNREEFERKYFGRFECEPISDECIESIKEFKRDERDYFNKANHS